MAGCAGNRGMVTWTGKLPSGAPIREWAADITVDTFEATGMASSPVPRGKERVVGLYDATGTISFVHSTTGAAELPGGSAVRLTLQAYTSQTYAFDALLVGTGVTCVVDGECLITYNFQMSDSAGPIITTDPTASPGDSPH